MWGLLLVAFLANESSSPPRVLHRVEPRYTREARANGIQGTVLIEMTVDETGRPGDVSVLSPIGFGLDNRAIDAVRQWTFRAATNNYRSQQGPVRITC